MDELHLKSQNRKYGLEMDGKSIKQVLVFCRKSEHLETGGVLIGYYGPLYDIAVVTNVIGPPGDSGHRGNVFT